MILSSIKNHLSSRENATSDELSAALGIDRGIVEQAIETWERKGKIKKETIKPPCSCACGCSEGCSSTVLVYRWIE
ncbi:MAG TPA: FeoC-like transcriptional regulator [Spirochaetota bacterium]|nr:FeoC-like transcriptional regulator [Spirochaetota bacterium]HPI87863.1 FeoC-like transcriptional regulator [Spirochaetota bacterium]HPR47405.1 FeoC-like transcriptional regulator [Spirochaetota bacterium]